MAQRLATKAEVLAVAPEFQSLDPPRLALVDVLLEIAGTMISLRTWKAKASHGHALLTAHLVASHPDVTSAAEGGPLASVTVGPVSKSYAVTASKDTELGTTTYGRMYLAMRKTLKRTPLAIGRGLKQF